MLHEVALGRQQFRRRVSAGLDQLVEMIRDVLVELAASDRHCCHIGIPLIPAAKSYNAERAPSKEFHAALTGTRRTFLTPPLAKFINEFPRGSAATSSLFL